MRTNVRRSSLMLSLLAAMLSLMFISPGSAWSFLSSTAATCKVRPSLFLPPPPLLHNKAVFAQPLVRKTVIPRFSSAYSSVEPEDEKNNNKEGNDSLRGRLRKVTGFSLTALRASMRALTGVSLTAIYVAAFTATGAWIRQITKIVLSIFPPPVRYFFQPFLVLYYAPLFILRNLTGPTRKRALQSHEHVLDGWRAAVEKAENTVSYWPIHVDKETGNFELDGTVDLEEGIEESVNLVMEKTMEDDVPPLKGQTNKPPPSAGDNVQS